MAENDDGFLRRWARRKDEARQGAQLPEASPASPTGNESARAESEQTPAERAADEAKLIESLPDIDSMSRESDFSVFMQKGVPTALRKKALRKLWRLDPVFANLDGLNDYDEDYTAIGKPMAEGVKTIYQVGRGMLHRESEEAERATSGTAVPEHGSETAGSDATTKESTSAPEAQETPPVEQPASAGAPTGEPDGGAEASTAGPIATSKAHGRESAAPPRRGAVERRWGRFTNS